MVQQNWVKERWGEDFCTNQDWIGTCDLSILRQWATSSPLSWRDLKFHEIPGWGWAVSTANDSQHRQLWLHQSVAGKQRNRMKTWPNYPQTKMHNVYSVHTSIQVYNMHVTYTHAYYKYICTYPCMQASMHALKHTHTHTLTHMKRFIRITNIYIYIYKKGFMVCEGR